MTEDDWLPILGEQYEAYKRFPDCEDVTLAFGSQHVSLAVDPKGTVVGLSVYRPRVVVLNGVSLLDEETSFVAEALRAAGVNPEIVDAGLWCKSEGIMLVDVDGRIDGVELGSV